MEWALFAPVLAMGFLGSWHCGVMCGPLSCNFQKRSDFGAYHFGRLFSYLVIGSLLFWGSQFFLTSDSRSLKIISSIVFALTFFYFGLKQMKIIQFHKAPLLSLKWQFRLFKKTRRLSERFPVLLGLLTGLFPCGWLYSFLLLGSQMPDLTKCLLLIFCFWLTSLPAFFVFTGFMQSLIRHSPVSYQRISGAVLIAAGLLSILGHWAYFITS